MNRTIDGTFKPLNQLNNPRDETFGVRKKITVSFVKKKNQTFCFYILFEHIFYLNPYV